MGRQRMFAAAFLTAIFATAVVCPARSPVPDSAALAEPQRAARQLFAAAIAGATTPDARADLARRMSEAALAAEDVPTQYTLLEMARDQAARAGAWHLTLQTLGRIESAFEVDAFALSVETLAAISRSIRPAHAGDGAVRAIALGRKALDDGDFASAQSLAGSALMMARIPRDAILTRQANELLRDVATVRTASVGASPAAEALSIDPRDPAANLALGQYECFLRGRWDVGLAMLAKGGDAKLQQLAALDLAVSDNPAVADTKQVYAAAEGWWQLAARHTGIAQRNIRLRAKLLYEQVLPRLGGLEKPTAENRLAELARDRTLPRPEVAESRSVLILSLMPEDLAKWWNLPAGVEVEGGTLPLSSGRGLSGRFIIGGNFKIEMAVSQAAGRPLTVAVCGEHVQVMGLPRHLDRLPHPLSIERFADELIVRTPWDTRRLAIQEANRSETTTLRLERTSSARLHSMTISADVIDLPAGEANQTP